MASVVVAGPQGCAPGGTELERLEREAADWHRAWQSTRQLGAWTRYTECRKKLAELSARGRSQAKCAREEEERTQQEAK